MVLSLLPQDRLKLRRFFVSAEQLAADNITISDDLFRHMAIVLRLAQHDQVLLADGNGNEALGCITEITASRLCIMVSERCRPPVSRNSPVISLYQGMPKGEKMDLIVQKCTELGVAEIVPFFANRSIVRLEGKQLELKLKRWQRIAQESARQSEQTKLPTLAVAKDLSAAICMARQELKLLVWEKAVGNSLKNSLAASSVPESVAILIGPEGGITETEAELAIKGGFQAVSLGPRILRTETAGLAMLAILQYQWGELGN